MSASDVQWQNVQEIPIFLRDCSLTPFRKDYVLQNPERGSYLFVDEADRFLIELLRSPTTIAVLIQEYHGRYRVYSYKKVMDLVVRLLRGSFLALSAESALLEHDFFKPFAPELDHGIRITLSFDRVGRILAPLFRWADSAVGLAAMALMGLWDLYALFLSPVKWELLSLNSRHAPALGLWIFGLILIVMLKNGFKFHLLKSKGIEAQGSGIHIRRGIPRCRVNDAQVLTQGWSATLRFHLACLLFPCLLAFVSLAMHAVRPFSGAGIWAGSCLLWILLDLSPFLQGELTKAMDRLSGSSRLWETVTEFLRRKLMRRIFAFGSTFELEIPLIGFGVYAVLWLFAAYKIVGYGLGHEFDRLSDAFVLEESLLERVCAASLMAGILLPFFSLIAGVLRLLALNIYSLIENPLHELVDRVVHALRRKDALPVSEVAGFLRGIPLFSGLSESDRTRLAESVEVDGVSAHRRVVWQGARGDAFYVIYRGEADVYREEESGRRTNLAQLSARDSFGEIALLEDVPRTATVQARTPMINLILRKTAFSEFVQSCPQDKDQIVKVIRWTAFLKKVPLFSDLPPELMTRVVLEMKERKVCTQEVLIREGDAAEEFFILHTGAAGVWKDHGRTSAKLLAKLSAGDHFGEIALFDQSPRTATVVAERDSTILVMPRASFFLILRTSVFSGVWVEESIQRRKKEKAVTSS